MSEWLVHKARESAQGRTAERFEKRARDTRRQADSIRRALAREDAG